MSEYTSGPWGVSRINSLKVGSMEGNLVKVNEKNVSREGAKANAKLIAAAPELLEELIKSNSILKQQQKLGCNCNGVRECSLCKQIKQNKKIIARMKEDNNE